MTWFTLEDIRKISNIVLVIYKKKDRIHFQETVNTFQLEPN